MQTYRVAPFSEPWGVLVAIVALMLSFITFAMDCGNAVKDW